MPTVGTTARARPALPGRRQRTDRGTAALEFALVLPLLAMMLLGAVTGGLAFSRGISLTDAVRESARFGATADATNTSTWVDNVIAQERATQIDDSTSTTAVCVQLWKGPAAGGVEKVSKCDQGTFGTPTLAVSDAAFPAVPSTVAAGTCVVRVLAARKYDITLAPFPSLSGTMKRASVARYERTC